MAWLAAAIVVVAVLYFSIHHPGFRKVVLITLAVVVAAAAAGGGYLYWQSERQAARSAYAKTLITKDDIDFYNLTLQSSYGSHSVRGTVRNRSLYPLKSFGMRITIQDCPAGKCETIGEYNMWQYGVDVPPGQVRSFDGYVSFPGMPTPVAQQWYYSVTELEASLD
ncbi:hypothetical protein I6F15_03550 [Bradyrhizobium sp. BRP14]|nr:hypothetical protein [Bradyrhizobium sp. BRP14]